MQAYKLLPAFICTAVLMSACGGNNVDSELKGSPMDSSHAVSPSSPDAAMVKVSATSNEPSTSSAAISFEQVQNEVFEPSCASVGCHGGPSAQMAVRLDSASHSFNSLVSVKAIEAPELFRIEPKNPDASYLIRKIEGGPDISGTRMPLGREPLKPAQIKLVRDWIAQGAIDHSGTLQAPHSASSAQVR